MIEKFYIVGVCLEVLVWGIQLEGEEGREFFKERVIRERFMRLGDGSMQYGREFLDQRILKENFVCLDYFLNNWMSKYLSFVFELMGFSRQ